MNLTAFFDSFQRVMGGVTAIIVIFIAIIVICFVVRQICLIRFKKLYFPTMVIYRGEKKIKNTYAPSYGGLQKCLNGMNKNDKLEITLRDQLTRHPIYDLKIHNSCKLSSKVELVGFEHNGSTYLTIIESTIESIPVRYKILNGMNDMNDTDEEYEKLKSKNWWKMERIGKDKIIIKRTELPVEL